MSGKQTSWFDDLLMSASRRGNDIVGGLADLADHYGVSPANSAAWVAQHLGGYSPEEAARIRRNLGGIGNFRNVVEAGVRSNEDRFRRAGGRGARAPEDVQMPVRLGAVAYKPLAAPLAVIPGTPGALRAAGNYVMSHTPSDVAHDVGNVATHAYEDAKADPYSALFDTALYSAFPMTASVDDYAAMRGASQSIDPYVKDNAEAAKAQQMADAASLLPLAVAVPIVRSHLRKKRGGLAVKKGRK